PIFLRRLVSLARPDRGVVPVNSGLAEPMSSIYPRRALPEIAARRQRRLGDRHHGVGAGT
ncbi:MAG: hypothetical protein AAB214_09205, partial [Fibrobacterota bacterium]